MKQRLSHTAKLAQAAGSLSALALLPAGAQAGIVYHPEGFGPITVTSPNTFWDVDTGSANNNGAEFNLHGSSGYASMDSNGLNARGLVQANGQFNDAFQKLAAGFGVGPTLAGGYQWGGAGQNVRTIIDYYGNVGGDAAVGGFVGGGNEYFGFRFTDSTGGLFYGWANLNIDLANSNFSIQCWAYNDQANGSINVGDAGSATSCGQTAGGVPGTLHAVLGPARLGRGRRPGVAQAQAGAGAGVGGLMRERPARFLKPGRPFYERRDARSVSSSAGENIGLGSVGAWYR
jgi:hypothetical protein